MGNLVRFLNTNDFPYFKNSLSYYKGGVEAVNSKVVELAPGPNLTIASYNGSDVKYHNAALYPSAL
jgi:hypothetical protein